MAGYAPLKITGNASGLVQEREEFLLPDDAYPTLLNAYVWRERILRKKGLQLLGRLQRNIGTTDGIGGAVINIVPTPIQTGIASFVIGTDIFVDPGTTANPATQTLLTNSAGTGTLNRLTGVLTITGSPLNTPIQYFPGLPVMGIRIQELLNSANDRTIFFDQVYAYIYNSGTQQFQEFIPNTTWNAHNGDVTATDFFWSTNYWTSFTPTFSTTNVKLFWETNDTGQFGNNADPPRITDGTTWVDFDSSTWNQIDATNFLFNYLANLPFRGRMVAFNTWEGPTKGSALNFSNRIRWATIGNPFITFSNVFPAKGSWRSDIRGQGGFLDIPTSEDIVAVGYVRDNLVIYCERSTWQLRYTGRQIAPFQIEKVNSELGAQSLFSAIQFDTSLVGIGDKGIVECDSYKSERIDIKIPDFVWKFQNNNAGVTRVQGIRDFERRLAFWTIPIATSNSIFPNQRLIYNYENDSWALFEDSLTALGNFQPQDSRTWLNTHQPWIECNFPWINQPALVAEIVGGNQQGFVGTLDELATNDSTLFISNITQGDTVEITSPNHNMATDFIIGISDIPMGTPFSSLNGGIFGIVVSSVNKFTIYTYNTLNNEFNIPVIGSPSGIYTGGGLINIRENFKVKSKKFNFLDDGQSIQMGYLDILMDASGNDNPGDISFNVYLDYDDVNSSNAFPKNQIDGAIPPQPDTFFNTIIPTTPSSFAVASQGSKFWQRVYCPTRANFLTLEYTFSNSQMNGKEQEQEVQIDAQVLWIRKAGRMTNI